MQATQHKTRNETNKRKRSVRKTARGEARKKWLLILLVRIQKLCISHKFQNTNCNRLPMDSMNVVHEYKHEMYRNNECKRIHDGAHKRHRNRNNRKRGVRQIYRQERMIRFIWFEVCGFFLLRMLQQSLNCFASCRYSLYFNKRFTKNRQIQSSWWNATKFNRIKKIT